MADGEIDGGPGRLSNVVFMGMGEPLANYARVRKTLDALLTPAPHGLGLSQRSVTVSTVGLVPAIRRLTEEGRNVTLADRKSTRLNSSHANISYAVFCLKKNKITRSA